jgi:hypothetical protein
MRQSLSRLGRTAVVVPGIAAALALAGCKDNSGSSASGSSPPASAPASSTAPGSASSAPGTPQPSPSGTLTGRPVAPGTKLSIVVRMSPSAKPVTYTLGCSPPGGTVPHAADACAALVRAAAVKGGDPFAPTPKGQMCTQIFGGPQTATVTGTWNGKPVHATFSRKNGCEVKRWNDIAAIFGPLPHTPTY